MESVVVGSFSNWDAARGALDRLHAAGFHHESLNVLAVEAHGQGGRRPDLPSKAPEGAIAGATLGGALGAVEGFALATILIPGIGPFLAAGPILATFAGLAAGAGAGGVLGTLMGAGFPREDAEAAERALGRGEILISIPATGREDEARSILEGAGARNVHADQIEENRVRPEEFLGNDDVEMDRLDRRAEEIAAAAAPTFQSGNVGPGELPLGNPTLPTTGAVAPGPGASHALSGQGRLLTHTGTAVSAAGGPTTPDSAAHNQQRAVTGTQVGASDPYVPGVSNTLPVDPPTGHGDLEDEDDAAPAEGMTGLRNVIR